MPNRYTRDQILLTALNMVQLPNLERHDAPTGTIAADAYSIQWLQDILDYWFHVSPFSATVKDVAISCVANNDTVVLPSDFILDVRNGLEVQTIPGDANSYKKKFRLPLQKFRNQRLKNQGAQGVKYPEYYCIVGDDGAVSTQYQEMRVTPTPSIATLCVLWYYALPAVLTGAQKPKLPSDYVGIEYVRLRGLEWAGIMEPGTAHRYAEKIVSTMKASGLMNEPEDDEIPMDEVSYRHRGRQSVHTSWMGPV